MANLLVKLATGHIGSPATETYRIEIPSAEEDEGAHSSALIVLHAPPFTYVYVRMKAPELSQDDLRHRDESECYSTVLSGLLFSPWRPPGISVPFIELCGYETGV